MAFPPWSLRVRQGVTKPKFVCPMLSELEGREGLLMEKVPIEKIGDLVCLKSISPVGLG